MTNYGKVQSVIRVRSAECGIAAHGRDELSITSATCAVVVLIRPSPQTEHARGEVAMPDEVPIGQAVARGAVGGTVLESKPRIPFLARSLSRFASSGLPVLLTDHHGSSKDTRRE